MRAHAEIYMKRQSPSTETEESISTETSSKLTDTVTSFKLGSLIMQFMLDRNLIEFCIDTEESKVKSKGGRFYSETPTFVHCTLDLKLLPIKLNLPMVTPPVDWQPSGKKAKYIPDLRGGYLSTPTSELSISNC
jgi:hypothetical protein